MSKHFADCIDHLPRMPGIYCILNRFTGRRWVGLTKRSMNDRARAHRQTFTTPHTAPAAMVGDLLRYGPASMIFLSLEVHDADSPRLATTLRDRELWWARELLALDQHQGYNLEAGGLRSPASRFRDHERKLLRAGRPTYQLLPGIDSKAPIGDALLATWQPRYTRVHLR